MKKLLSLTLIIVMAFSVLLPSSIVTFAAENSAELLSTTDPVIACWGDSLTYGQGATNAPYGSYPSILSNMTGLTVHNMGVGGETSVTIAARQGALDIKLKEGVTIPADTSEVEISIAAYNPDGTFAGEIVPRNTSIAGWNPCTINGIEGELSISVSTDPNIMPRVLNWAKFKRTTAGSATEVAAGTEVTVAAQAIAQDADINIFFTGTNGGWNENHTNPNDAEHQDLVDLTDKMIAATKPGSKNLVIGLTTGGASSWSQTNAALKAKYGDHFIDAKEYLSSAQALADAGLSGTATPGVVNSAFLTDDTVHLNSLGYHMLAKLVHDKLIDLGYVDARTSLTKHMEATDAAQFTTFTANDGTVTTVNGFGGKRADDVSMKVTYNGTTATDCFTNISYLSTIGTVPSVVALSLYPSADMRGFQFARGAAELTSKSINYSALKANQWNRIVCYYDPTTFTSKLYINGAEVSSSCDTVIDKPTRTDVRLIMNFNKSNAGAEFYYDDIAVYTGSTYVNPPVIGTQYTIANNFINLWGTDTVATLKTKIGLGADEYNIKVYNASGTLKQDSEALAATDTVHICDGTTVLERYYMGSATSEAPVTANIDHQIAAYRTAAELAAITPLYYCTTGETQTGVGGRRSDDASAKITYLGERTTGTGSVVTGQDCFVDITIPAADAIEPIFITTDLYPNEHYSGFQFATGGSATLSGKIPASALNLNQWNRLALLYDPDALTSKVYINGDLYATYDSSVVTAIAQNKIRLINWQTATTAVNEVFYMDDIAVYSGTALLPTITESAYDITDKYIYDTVGTTVGALTSNITLNGYSLNVYNSEGTLKGNSDAIALSDKIQVVYGSILIEEYYPAPPAPPSVTTIKEAYNEADFANLNVNYTEKAIATGVGDRRSDDASMKLTYVAGDTDAFIDFASLDTINSTPFAVAISIYPSADMRDFRFARGGSEAISSAITPAMLNMNQWNRLVCYYDHSTLTSRLFINGKEVPTSNKGTFTESRKNIRLIANFDTSKVGAEFYYDDIAVYSGRLDFPYITETSLTMDGMYIHGWGGKTVAELKESFTMGATTYSIAVLDSTGQAKGNDASVASTDTFQLLCNTSVLERYYPGIASYEIMGDPVLYTNGYSAGDNKFGTGTTTVTQKIGAYSGSINVMAILAYYDENDVLRKAQVTPQTVSGDDEISASIVLESAEGTLKFLVWEDGVMTPMSVPTTFASYSESTIENVAPLYEGYSTKSVVFNYDDGVWQEYMLLDLLDQYGIKCTFNFISGMGEGTQPTLQSRKESQVTKAKAAGDADALAATDWIDYVKRAYIDKGHEISSHTRDHWPSHLDEGEISYSSTGVELVGVSTEDEIIDIQGGVTDIEGWFGTDVIGLAWPNGFGWQRNDYETDLKPAMEEIGLKYARGDESYGFDLPTDWYVWEPTCHHNDAPGYANKFVSLDNSGDMKCFFNWGHAYEFDTNKDDPTRNWAMLEGVMQTLATDDTIWYATNGDIYRYVEATKLLETTATTVKNNSTMTVYCNINGKNVELSAGETYTIGE